jgi:hypothetical protein
VHDGMAHWEAVSQDSIQVHFLGAKKESTELHKVRPTVRALRNNTPAALERPRPIYG